MLTYNTNSETGPVCGGRALPYLYCSDHSDGGLGADKIASLGSFGSISNSWRSSGSFRNAAVSSGCGTCKLSLLYSFPFRYYMSDCGDPQNV